MGRWSAFFRILYLVVFKLYTQTGGRDTAGLGGVGGYKRLFKNHEIKQVPDSVKKAVPEHIQERARRMAQEELARRLEELNLSAGDAAMYDRHLSSIHSHVAQLHDLLESKCYTSCALFDLTTMMRLDLAAKEEERVWIKRQTDGELDFGRLTEGLTGETSIYKRRGMAQPDSGRPQIKYCLPSSAVITFTDRAAGRRGLGSCST